MKLTLFFDHRLVLDSDGTVFSLHHYNYKFFVRRYLGVFDRVRVVSRLSRTAPRARRYEAACGPGVEFVSVGDWDSLGSWTRSMSRVRRILRMETAESEAAILIAPGVLASLAGKLLRNGRKPYGVEVVGDPYDIFAAGSVRHPLRSAFRWWFPRELRRLCKGAAGAIYVTEHALQRRYPCPTYSVGVSDAVLPAEAFVQRPRTYAEDRAWTTFVFIGSLAQLYKAPDVLLAAIARAVEAGEDFRLVLVGDGRCRPELEAQARGLGIQDRVRFAGQLPAGVAVREELDRADIFVLPSRQEGLPRAMVEAMARALPCIGSAVGGVPELLDATELVQPGDVAGLSSKMRELASSSRRLAILSKRNLEQAQRYSETVIEPVRRQFYEAVRDAAVRIG